MNCMGISRFDRRGLNTDTAANTPYWGLLGVRLNRNHMATFRKALLFLLTAMVLPPTWAQDPDDVEQLKVGQPKDVAAFVSRSFYCQHFGGEPAYDAARAKEIEKSMRRYRCDEIDSDDRSLRQKYSANRKVLKVLDVVAQFSD